MVGENKSPDDAQKGSTRWPVAESSMPLLTCEQVCCSKMFCKLWGGQNSLVRVDMLGLTFGFCAASCSGSQESCLMIAIVHILDLTENPRSF